MGASYNRWLIRIKEVGRKTEVNRMDSSSGSGKGTMSGYCEHGNELSESKEII